MISRSLKTLVPRRASNRCEYCQLRQEQEPFYRFHIEHIIARQHGGRTIADNLALACYHCNAHKGTNLVAIDPKSGQVVRLYHPRLQRWKDHFTLRGYTVVGLSDIGRATLGLLKMNAARRVELRASVQAESGE